MNQNEKDFKGIITRIAFALIIFTFLSEILLGTAGLLQNAVMNLTDSDIAYAITDLISSAAYLATFMLPVLFFKLMASKSFRPMKSELKFPRSSDGGVSIVPIILAGIAVIFAAAYINSFLVNLFDYSKFTSEVFWSVDVDKDYKIVLLFISTAIVPAFCEEFLFRGMVLENLLPFGKWSAILISAISFGLMHQNIEQLFYATVAGVVLGIIYVETGNIWTCTLLHMFNNLVSVLETVVWERCPEETAAKISLIIEGFIFFAGFLSLIYIVTKFFKRRKREKNAAYLNSYVYENGLFGRDFEGSLTQNVATEKTIKRNRIVKFYFSPAMICYIAICVLKMILYIIMSLIYEY